MNWRSLIAPGNYENLTTLSSAWSSLRFLNIYRVILAGLFVVLVATGAGAKVLGNYNPPLFALVSLIYLSISILNSFTIRWRWLAFNHQVYTQVLVDIIAITVLTHASGGVISGLGMLLVVAIAGGSILMAGRIAFLFAAIATIAILLEELYSQLHHPGINASYTHAGILGASMFATAYLSHALAKRIRESEALAQQRGIDLASMEQLNEYIIQHMQTGIMVVDDSGTIRLINESGWRLLDMPSEPFGKPLEDISHELYAQLCHWQQHDHNSKTHSFRVSTRSPAIVPRFASLGKGEDSGTLIFIEDTSVAIQQAQQLKLASLGRLTASIAHEIRNPLGAISHASQLLHEAPEPDNSNQRLTQIILDNSERVNRIIETILNLSRRDRARPELFPLVPWLHDFVDEFVRTHDAGTESVSVSIEPDDLMVRMDPTQLHQILWNLCKNALRHSMDYPGVPKVELVGGVAEESAIPYIDIVDHGKGVNPDTVEHLFEPFFTTEYTGTGLGLYIARELCAGNQARLDFISTSPQGSRFRITFADPRRRQVA